VKAFHKSLKAARDGQKGREGERDMASNDAEAARVALAAALFANVGRLMEKHSEEPHRIEDYFDLSLIRQTGSGLVVPVPVPAAAPIASAPRDAAAAPGNGGSAGAMLPTEVTPRRTGNGMHEHAKV